MHDEKARAPMTRASYFRSACPISERGLVLALWSNRLEPEPIVQMPEGTGRSRPELVDRLDGLGSGAIDRNGARLLGLGEQALQLDMEQAVLERSTGDFHILGQLEAQLEGALGNAAMEELTSLAFALRSLGTLDDEAVLFGLETQVAVGKAGDGDRDAIGVLADLLDVVGRIGLGFLAHEAGEAVEQPVEADGRTIEGGKIVGLHLHILRSEQRDDVRVSHTPSRNRRRRIPGWPGSRRDPANSLQIGGVRWAS